jgi:hypothetical protein
MNTAASVESSVPVSQAFQSDTVVVALDQLLPVKAIGKAAKASHKYRQIAKSILEIGLVEPPVVAPGVAGSNTYLLLDGHLRVDVLRDMGITTVECIVSTDDEAFTYNKRQSTFACPRTENDSEGDRKKRAEGQDCTSTRYQCS